MPEPTGPLPTGTTLTRLVDRERVDPLAPAGGPRELMAQFWYPAIPVGRPAPYAQPQEAAAMERFYALPPGAFVGATTHSLLDAPALPGHRPVVVFSHGLCAYRTDGTAVAEQLASLGYVVVALGATHESDAVEFPDGRLVSTADPVYCTAAQDPNNPLLATLQENRVADVSFVLDQLRKRLPHGLNRAVDPTRVGVFGHSFGGSTAAQAVASDPRVDAGIDLDGLIAGTVRQTGVTKPFLVMGSDYHDTVLDPSWADFLPKMSGWHRWLRVRTAGHYRFVDLGGSPGRWGLETTMPPETWQLVFGDIDDQRSQRILVDYPTAFFQKFLRGIPSPLLDRPSPRYPEVEFRTTN